MTTALVALALARVASGEGGGSGGGGFSSSSFSPASSTSSPTATSSSSSKAFKQSFPPCPADAPPGDPCLPRDLATEAGYMRVGPKSDNAELFFLYQEADSVLLESNASSKKKKTADASPSPSASTSDTSTSEKTPIIIWLQGGPGSSSLLGAFFEMGRYVVQDGGDGSLHRNPDSWTRDAAMLFVEYPLGVGFSLAGLRRLPPTSAAAAVDLVSGLQNFFQKRPQLAGRPLVLAGESYAGKYVPEAAALALQLASDDEATRWAAREAAASRDVSSVASSSLPPASSPLAFALRGAAVGNGLVDPPSQAARMGPYLFARGLINVTTLKRNERRAANLTSLAAKGLWAEVHSVREAMVSSLTRSALGSNGTLLDWRRSEGYDAADRVKVLLRTPAARAALNVDPSAPVWQRRAKAVASALHDDKAVSSAPIVAEVVTQVPVLLYYGVEDAKVSFLFLFFPFSGLERKKTKSKQLNFFFFPPPLQKQKQHSSPTHTHTQIHRQDGYFSSQPWIAALDWPGAAEFKAATPKALPPRAGDGVSGGIVRSGGGLTVATVADAGHMVPADQPAAARAMINLWLRDSVLPSYEADLAKGDSPAARRAAADAEVERQAEAAAEATATAEAAANAAAAAAMAADAAESMEPPAR